MDAPGVTVFKQDGSHQFYCRWTPEEDQLLCKAVQEYGLKWSKVARHINGRTPVQCSTRWLGALNPNVHKGRWSQQEDQILRAAVEAQLNAGVSATSLPWSKIARGILNRTGIQCQARWTEALDPSVRKGRWDNEEDQLLMAAVARFGTCWIRVASQIPSRTQRQCRTRWNQIRQNKKSAATAAATQSRRSFQFIDTPLPEDPKTPTLTTPPLHFTPSSIPTAEKPRASVFGVNSFFYPPESFLRFDPDLPSLVLNDECLFDLISPPFPL
ncbi:Homeodomain-like protein [Radiomyces spectabilis]|uniref:Homeodomain-like protein n=1 Tax=Radiomyces spectabilis TaxID=64574 RepID=UPI00221F9CC0|nr:Homeodomain-like protein [Radiomyces spectabilis]KAI8379404.1 Homeodomain-like protein [Radiomyces spectabilis]